MRSAFPYREDIDGLRALAVLAVMAFHLDERFLPGGFTGVDVFFVISGYVVTAALLARQEDTLGRFLLNFYGRRIARIVPALAVMIALTLVLYLRFIPILPWVPHPAPEIALHALLGTGNLGLLLSRHHYFGGDTALNPWLHTWSLGIEEQFYLAAPLLVFWWIRRQGSPLLAWLPIVVCTGMSLGLCAIAQQHDPELNFYLVLTRLWELGAGTLLCLWLARGHAPDATEGGRLRAATSFIGFVLVAAGFAWARPDHSPWPDVIPAVGGTVLLIHAGARGPRGLVNRLLALPVLVRVGKLSYSLYLWHWPVYVGLRWTVGLESPGIKVAAIVLSIGLASLSYQFIEQPARRLSLLTRAPSLRAVVGCLVVIVGLAALGAGLSKARRDFSISQVTRGSGIWTNSVSTRAVPQAICTASVDKHGRQDHIIPVNCAPGRKARAFASRQLFVLGDSHAWHMTGALGLLASTHGLRSTILWKVGCEYILGLHRMSQSTCLAFNETRLRHVLENARPGDFVLLSSLRVPRYRSPPTKNDDRPTTASAAAELSPWMEPLLDAGLHVIISAPTPIFKEAPWRCLDPWVAAKPSCAGAFQNDRDALVARRAPVMRAIENLLARYPQVTLWDPFPILCPPGHSCSTRKDDVLLFHDTDHLTLRGAERLSTSLRETLERIAEPAGNNLGERR